MNVEVSKPDSIGWTSEETFLLTGLMDVVNGVESIEEIIDKYNSIVSTINADNDYEVYGKTKEQIKKKMLNIKEQISVFLSMIGEQRRINVDRNFACYLSDEK